MDLARIEELIKVLDTSAAEEICVRSGDVGVCIRKGPRRRTGQSVKGADAVGEPAERDRSEKNEPGLVMITAPMVGIFHKVDGMPTPGNHVTPGQVVGTIESMKLLNDVVSDVSGVITQVLVEDGSPVEYGQPLCALQAEQ